jgi:hypothetical protein
MRFFYIFVCVGVRGCEQLHIVSFTLTQVQMNNPQPPKAVRVVPRKCCIVLFFTSTHIPLHAMSMTTPTRFYNRTQH